MSKESFSWQARLSIIGGLSLVLVIIAFVLNSPALQNYIVEAVDYSGSGGWTASGTIGGQPYSETWTATAAGYDVSGSLGSDAFDYTFTGSYPALPGGGGGDTDWTESGGNVYRTSGNIGIGTSSPGMKLDVAQNNAIRVGQAYLSSGGDYAHLANNEWWNGSSWQAYGNGALLQLTGQNTHFYRHTNGSHTHSMTINSAGNVGIGTSGPQAKLHVVGDIRIPYNQAIRFGSTCGFTDGGCGEYIRNSSPNGSSGFGISFFVSSGQRMRLDGAGNTFITGNYLKMSDISKKKDIVELTGVLDKVDLLRGVFFNWKDEGNANGRQIGVIAQEVEEVYPEIVLEDAEGFKNVDYDQLAAILIEAVKELKAENDDLRARVELLEGR